MKIILKMTLAVCLLTGTAWAQNEQWLEYHTGNDARSFHSMKLTTNPPAGVALPALVSQPYFAYWKTPMDPKGGRWMCFDRTRKSGPYDRLYIDSNGNGRLDDKPAVPARLDSFNAFFPATPLVFKGEDGPVTYHLILRFYQYERSPAQLLASAGGWYEGVVSFGSVKRHIQLIDGNVNGTFNDIDPDAYGSDRIQIQGDKNEERFLGQMVELNGKLFRIEVPRDGAFIKVQPADNVVFGSVHVPENISDFSAYGANGHFIRKPANGDFTLPVGKYQVVRWTISRKDEKGAAWTLSGYNFPKTNFFEVTAAQLVAVDIGEPVRANLAMEGQDKQILFRLSFVGKQNESVELLRDNQRPRGPKLMLANAAGTLCYTNTFEFG